MASIYDKINNAFGDRYYGPNLDPNLNPLANGQGVNLPKVGQFFKKNKPKPRTNNQQTPRVGQPAGSLPEFLQGFQGQIGQIGVPQLDPSMNLFQPGVSNKNGQAQGAPTEQPVFTQRPTPLSPEAAKKAGGDPQVSALQAQLNSLGANLNIDGIYGPLTQAAAQQYLSGTPAVTQERPTAENGFGAATNEPTASPFDFSQFQQQESQADQFANKLFTDRQQPVDRDAIRNDTRKRFQSEIDAINSVFDQMVAEARVEGKGRLGSGRAIQARGGLLGSARGGAQTEQIKGFNEEVIGGINAKRNAAISGIFSKADELAQADILDREQAAREGADSFLSFLQNKEERKRSNTDSLINAMIQQGVDINELSQEELFNMANTLQVQPQDLVTIYQGKVAEATPEEGADFTGTTTDFRTFKQFFPEGDYEAYKQYLQETEGTSGGGSGGSTSGASQADIDSWVSLIQSGEGSISNVPQAIRSQVVTALAQSPEGAEAVQKLALGIFQGNRQDLREVGVTKQTQKEIRDLLKEGFTIDEIISENQDLLTPEQIDVISGLIRNI